MRTLRRSLSSSNWMAGRATSDVSSRKMRVLEKGITYKKVGSFLQEGSSLSTEKRTTKRWVAFTGSRLRHTSAFVPMWIIFLPCFAVENRLFVLNGCCTIKWDSELIDMSLKESPVVPSHCLDLWFSKILHHLRKECIIFDAWTIWLLKFPAVEAALDQGKTYI